MKKNKIALVTIICLVAIFVIPVTGNVNFVDAADPIVNCTFSTTWKSNPWNYEVAEGATASFKLILAPTSMCGMSFTITPLTEGFTFDSLSTSMVSAHEEREVSIGIKMPEKNYESQQYKTFRIKINPSSGNTKVLEFTVNYVQSCGDFITGWTNNPSGYEVEAGKQATFEFIVKNRCDEDDVGITISTDDRFISFSNKKFNVLADKQFKIQVSVTMPPTRRGYEPESNTWEFKVKGDSGVTKNVKFSVNYK